MEEFSAFGRMEGDGGLTVFTTRCSARVVKGLVELVRLSSSPSGSSAIGWPQYGHEPLGSSVSTGSS